MGAAGVRTALDAMTDPMFGFLSDGMRWQIGGKPVRRRFFIGLGSLLLSIMYFLLWSPCTFFIEECNADKPTICEDGSNISGSTPGYFLVVYCIYFCTMGMTLVPYEALGAELTPGHKDRSTLFATYFFFTVVGILLAILLPGQIASGALSRILRPASKVQDCTVLCCTVLRPAGWAGR